eukprot:3816336-Amphidinium_carterae.2
MVQSHLFVLTCQARRCLELLVLDACMAILTQAHWVLLQVFSAHPSRQCEDSHGAKRARQVRHVDLNVLTLNIRSLAETGKLLFAAQCLAQLEVDIGCFQETRLKDDLPVESVGEYALFLNPASRYKGGLAILV